MTKPKVQSILFLQHKAPYDSTAVGAGIDVMLTAAAFDQDVTAVFVGAGVFQLLKNQDSSDIGLKNVGQVFPAFELYEIKKILVEEHSLQSRDLDLDDLLVPVELISMDNLARLLESVDQVFSF